jgi:hypothetical protein
MSLRDESDTPRTPTPTVRSACSLAERQALHFDHGQEAPKGYEVWEAEAYQPHTRRCYVVSGIIGGTAGLLLAMDAFRRDRSGPGLHPVETAWIPPLVTMVAIVAGVLVAWFVTALILSRAPGGERCPRCGSFNRRGVVACGACGLPLAGGLFRRAPQDA